MTDNLELLRYWKTQWDIGDCPPPIEADEFKNHWKTVLTGGATAGSPHSNQIEYQAYKPAPPAKGTTFTKIPGQQPAQNNTYKPNQKKGLWDMFQENIQQPASQPEGSTIIKSSESQKEVSKNIPSFKAYFPAFSSLEEYHSYLIDKGPYGPSSSPKTIMQSEGSTSAKIACLVLAPTVEEEKCGKLISGESEDLFAKILSAIGLQRSDIYITPIWKNAEFFRGLSQREMVRWLPLFLKELELLSVKSVILLGEKCAQTILKLGKDLNSLREEKSLHQIQISNQNIPAIATFHPQQLVLDPSLKRKAWEDWQWLQTQL